MSKPPLSKPRRRSLAARADRFELYQRSVQAPQFDVILFRRMYQKVNRREARILREDFCGTGYLSTVWARAHPAHVAYGYDIDPVPLAWGKKHNLAPLPPEVQRRVIFRRASALTVRAPKADLLVALNFSYFLFKTRAELVRYFRAARRNTAKDGLFILDVTGGPDCFTEMQEKRALRGFTYVWEQLDFDPITHRYRCAITFRFRDGSKKKRAFRYEWRFWSIPEVRELLLEAGFSRSQVFWEGFDSNGDGDGQFRARESASRTDADSWVAYIVAYP